MYVIQIHLTLKRFSSAKWS